MGWYGHWNGLDWIVFGLGEIARQGGRGKQRQAETSRDMQGHAKTDRGKQKQNQRQAMTEAETGRNRSRDRQTQKQIKRLWKYGLSGWLEWLA